ncbi:hypothetical protein [Massilia sp. PAMC28688]|uniref:hypothetical protein n=1 Tax=Massilia sp. PAMC28688 TaxID=2861283 RepID=UPI001E3730B2|nr:hypothetical protein [Massilia sp. PAMC28688]
MGTIVENVQEDKVAELPPAGGAVHARPRQSLPAKGSCWYCEKPLDSVRRFCGKECADAFEEEAEFDAEAINPPG